MTNDTNTMDNLKKSGSIVKDDLEKNAYELGSKVKEKINETQDYVKNNLQSLEDQTRSNPLLALSVSFLVGMVASKLISGGGSSRH